MTGPPHDLDAERALLSAALVDPVAVVPVLDEVPDDAFYHPAHKAIAAAVLGMADDPAAVDSVTVAARLGQTGDDDARALLLEVAGAGGIPTAAPSYATILDGHARGRRLLALAGELTAAANDGRHDDAARLLEHGLDEHRPTGHAGGLTGAVPLGDWLLDAPPGVPAVWGRDDEVLWPEGEAMLVVGGPGAGKTTIAGQVVFARLGLLDDVLGYPVAPTSARVLVLAMDRPRQIQRALGRLARPEHRDELNARCIVRPGPPARDLAKHPEELAAMARDAGADTVFVDSLKDAALGLADDEVGAGINRAIQIALADGIEVAANHHQRKGQNGTKPKTLEDVYGSTWIPAGAGSVVLLWGKPGDSLVELVHLKQPAASIGPLKIEHDHDAGRTTVAVGHDMLEYLRRQPRGADAEAAAHARFGRQPNDNERRVVRRQLDRLVKRGLAVKVDAEEGGPGGTTPARWHAVDDRRETP